MSEQMLFLIIGMTGVTFIPRALPFILLSSKPLPPFWQNVLRNIPYAILGALIFPSVLHIQANLWYGLLGAGIAIILSLIIENVIWVVLGSVALLTIVSIVM